MVKNVCTFMLLIVFAHNSIGQTAVLPLMAQETKKVYVDVPSMGSRQGGYIDITTGKFEKQYTYCRHQVAEISRNPQWREPEGDYAGYRLVQSKPQMIVWQWWVMPWRKYFDKLEFGLHAEFTVHWIRSDATKADILKMRCQNLPTESQVRTWPVEMDNNTPIGFPPPNSYFVATIDVECLNDETGVKEGNVQSSVATQISCRRSREEVLNRLQTTDVCRNPGNGTIYNQIMGQDRRWISTSSCPAQ